MVELESAENASDGRRLINIYDPIYEVSFKHTFVDIKRAVLNLWNQKDFHVGFVPGSCNDFFDE